MRSVIEEPATGEAEEVPSSHSRGLLRTPAGWALLLSTLAFLIAAGMNTAQGRFFVIERFQTFVTIFLGIFIEAVPFLLAGSLVSGLIDVFVGQDLIERFVPRQPILAALAGACLGLAFPVCECGVVPVTRRLYEKGLPPSVGVAFLLAAPVINPVVIVSTWAAFGGGPMLVGRIGFTIVIAFLIGLIFQTALPQEILLPDLLTSRHDDHAHGSAGTNATISQRSWQALVTAGDDFLDMARYLIAGSLLAAAMQTLVSQTWLLSVGQGPVVSVFALIALAFVLSVCSTVDAFLALAFTSTFTSGAILGFLTFGPMVDVKSSLMFLGVFRRRTVSYLILLPLALAALVGICWNLYGGM